MTILNIHLLHSWEKWVVISDKRISYSTLTGRGQLREIIQRRTCKECGLKEYKVTDID